MMWMARVQLQAKSFIPKTTYSGLTYLPYFVSQMMGERDIMTISWLYEDIKEIHMRWFQLRDHALEIFLTNGQTLLLAFENGKVNDEFGFILRYISGAVSHLDFQLGNLSSKFLSFIRELIYIDIDLLTFKWEMHCI